MNLGLSQTLSIRQTYRLIIRQKQEYLFSTRTALLNTIHGERYQLKSKCPICSQHVTPVDIIKGFNDDVNDYSTQCPKCKSRYLPRLSSGTTIRTELMFFCPAQALHSLRGNEELTPEEIKRKEPALYSSLLIHFNGLKSAFKKIRVNYKYNESTDWKTKVIPFLGKLSDRVIAECANCTPKQIRYLRKKLNIGRFYMENAFE